MQVIQIILVLKILAVLCTHGMILQFYDANKIAQETHHYSHVHLNILLKQYSALDNK